MIKATKKKWAEILFDFYLNQLLKKYFDKIILVGNPPSISKEKSLMILPNHFSWWDGFFVYKVTKNITSKKFHIMMLEEQLKRYWFFNKLGAYSIKQNNPKSVLESLYYSIELLNDKSNLTVIYPQGEIQPQEERQIRFNKGVNFICDKSTVDFQILPICFRIFYSNKKLPFVLYRCGNILSSLDVKNGLKSLQEEYESNIFSLFENKNLPLDNLYKN